MQNHTILFSKEGFVFSKESHKQFSLTLQLTNQHICLPTILDFGFVQLICQLNSDVFESSHLTSINDTQATLCIVVKHLFEDIGFSQRFVHMVIDKQVTSKKDVCFLSQTLHAEQTPTQVPMEAELVDIDQIHSCFHVDTPHQMTLKCKIVLAGDDDNNNNNNQSIVPEFAEKMIGLLLFKMFSRIKQFIEKIGQ